MPDPKTHELWRVDSKSNAYTDQTGISHYGHIVREKVIVVETGRFDQDQGYGVEPGVGILAIHPETGRTFRGIMPIDYCGRRHWKCGDQFWQGKPSSLMGYVNPDGSPTNAVAESPTAPEWDGWTWTKWLESAADVIDVRGAQEPRGALTYLRNMISHALSRIEPSTAPERRSMGQVIEDAKRVEAQILESSTAVEEPLQRAVSSCCGAWINVADDYECDKCKQRCEAVPPTAESSKDQR
jgi:hypothetical protein